MGGSVRFLFGWTGRADRGQFLIGVLIAGFLSTIVAMAFVLVVAPGTLDGGMYARDAVGVTTLLSAIPLTIRRLHDIGLSAWWGVPMMVLQASGFFVSWNEAGLGSALYALSALNFVALLAWPGQSSENRFGELPS